ncbi:MAG: tetratricopeptide repeat protein [Nitrospinae bacterium]|nr:tetratricopeptide repeat protein [Nitrospinota bacterium]
MKSRYSKIYSFDPAYFFIAAIFFIFFLLLEPLGRFSPWIAPDLHTGFYSITQIDSADDTSWYAYLRSMVIDGDIDFFNEEGYRSRDNLTSTGYAHNWIYSFGNAIPWLPYFLIGHIITLIYQGLGYPFPANGFSPPYHVLTAIGSSTNVLFGLFLLYLILKRFFSRFASFLAVIVIGFSSFLPFYAFIRSRMGHANEFLCVILFLYLWLVLFEGKRENPYYLLLGISAGVLAVVRLNDLPIIVIFLCEWGRNCWTDIKSGERNAANLLKGLVLFMVPIIIMLSPVLIISKILFNNYFSLENAKNTSDSTLALSSSVQVLFNWFSHFRLGPLLFSADKGLLFASPALILGFAGFFLFIKKHRYIGGVFFIGFLFNLLQVVTFWSFGVEYGTRYLTPSLPFFAIGLAAVLDRVKSKTGVIISCLAGIFLIFWQYIQLAQYKIFMAWDDPLFILKSFKNIPFLFNEEPSFLFRSTSWLNLVQQESFQLNTFIDYFFMVITPILQLFIPVCVLLLSIFFCKWAGFQKSLIDSWAKGLAFFLLLFFASLPPLLLACNPPKEKAEISSRYKILGLKSLSSGSMENAEESFRKSLEFQDRRDPAIEKLYGETLKRQGKLVEAVKIFEGALELDPKDTAIRLEASDIYLALTKYTEAIFHLEYILSSDPSSWIACKNLGLIYAAHIGDQVKAKEYLHKARTLAPSQAAIQEVNKILVKME